MIIDRRDFLISTGTGLVSLLFGRQTIANEQEIVMPPLEEITRLLPRTPQEILDPAIVKGGIKKFSYTHKTKPEEFYEFLNRFDKQRVFGFIFYDDLTDDKNKKYKNFWMDGKGNEETASASAIVFLYLSKNLKGKDIGFFFLELKDFYGEENWRELYKIFNIKRLSIPSLA